MKNIKRNLILAAVFCTGIMAGLFIARWAAFQTSNLQIRKMFRFGAPLTLNTGSHYPRRMKACEQIAYKYCGDVETGSDNVRNCILDHMSELSPECKDQAINFDVRNVWEPKEETAK